MRRPSRWPAFPILVCFALASCATKDEKEPPTYASAPSLATDPGASRTGHPLEAAVAGISLIFSAAQEKAAKKRGRRITGLCKVIFPPEADGERPERLCNDSYVLVRARKSKNEARVWMDPRGEFEFQMAPGEIYDITAVLDSIKAESKTLQLTRPGHVILQIDLRKEEDAEAKPR